MSPALPHNDLPHGIMAKSIILANSGFEFAGSDPGSYVSDDFSSDDLAVTPGAKGMTSIGLGIAPFEIPDTVIGPLKVNMVDHRQIIWIGDEGEGNQTMDAVMFASKRYAPVTVLVRFWRKYLGFLRHNLGGATPSVGHNALKTSDAAQARNFVDPLVPGDRAPFFDHDMLHIPYSGACQIKGVY